MATCWCSTTTRWRPAKALAHTGTATWEIVSYGLEGALAHQDNLHERANQQPGAPAASGAPGGDSVAAPTGILRPGDVQRMSAGSGVRHSEFNALPDQPTHFLQIWIKPLFTGIPPQLRAKTLPARRPAGPPGAHCIAPGRGRLSEHERRRLHLGRLAG